MHPASGPQSELSLEIVLLACRSIRRTPTQSQLSNTARAFENDDPTPQPEHEVYISAKRGKNNSAVPVPAQRTSSVIPLEDSLPLAVDTKKVTFGGKLADVEVNPLVHFVFHLKILTTTRLSWDAFRRRLRED